MPLFVTRNIHAGCKLALWKLKYGEEFQEEEDLLSDAERAYLQNMVHPLRRMQWLASRRLVRQLTGGQAAILYDRFSKPYLRDGGYRISISHSYDYVAVILDRHHETGIDIERIKDKVLRIQNKFMSADELQAVGGKDRAEKLYVYWCAKECLYKLYGKKELLFAKNIFIHPFTYDAEGELSGEIRTESYVSEHRLRYEKMDGYMLAYVLNS